MIGVRRRLYEAGLLSVALMSAVLLWRGYEAYQLMASKVVAQEREIKTVTYYAGRHAALQNAQKRFDQSFPSSESLHDWGDYFSHVDFPTAGLDVDLDKVSLNLSELPAGASAALGLHRACLGAGQVGELVVSAKSYSLLLSGLEKILSRPEIQAEGVTIIGDSSRPQARLAGFCMLFRK